MGAVSCPCCGGGLRRGLLYWHYECSSCDYEASNLMPGINSAALRGGVDESQREAALRAIRVANFSRLVRVIGALVPDPDTSLLDVGCAHGWFLEAAASRFRVVGIEPDEEIAGFARRKGLPVRVGYFPAVLGSEEKFGVIVFNDVFEHLPRVDAALDACSTHLADNGWLILNLPNVRGLFYRCARLLAGLGWTGPFCRMWQQGLPSPHLHYFSARSLAKLAARHNFMLQRSEEIDAVTFKGLWQRVRYAGSYHVLRDVVPFLGALALLPFARLASSDAIILFFRRA